MIKEAVEHSNTQQYIYPRARNCLVFRIRTARQDIQSCELVYWPRTSPDQKMRISMKCVQRDKLFDYYEIEVVFHRVARYLKYYFELTDHRNERFYITAYQMDTVLPDHGYYDYLYTNDNDIINPPDWAMGQIYYQIFPDRFKNGDPTNDREDCVPWGSTPTRENYMGGDLQGILQALNYIKELEVDCIYLTPVFKAAFNHKYATENYFRIDDDFGTKEDLKTLVQECHKLNIKVLLDGVFNHSGIGFAPFADVLENQENSEYKDWFYITKYPVKVSHHNYECVGAYKWMPKLCSANPKVKDYIVDVMDYWIEYAGIDGWRLDVADEVDYRVWQEAKFRLKEKHPDILLIGETWGYGHRLLQGDQLDGIMNYVFRDAMLDYFAKGRIRSQELDARLNHSLAQYYFETDLVLYNLLDSHDTPRFLTECGEDKRKFMLAAAFLFLYPGSPAIYYGDEIGIAGENDPDSRKAMLFDKEKQDLELLEWYRKLAQLRKQETAIRRGRYYSVFCDDEHNIYGFVRSADGEAVYVVVNNSENREDIRLPVLKNKKYTDLISGEDYIFNTRDREDRFYNQDILEYKGCLSLTIPMYSIKVIK